MRQTDQNTERQETGVSKVSKSAERPPAGGKGARLIASGSGGFEVAQALRVVGVLAFPLFYHAQVRRHAPQLLLQHRHPLRTHKKV